MTALIKAMGKIANGIKNIKKKLNKFSKRVEFVKKHGRGIITAIIIAFFIPIAAVATVIGAAQNFVNMCREGLLTIVGFSQEQVYESASDARLFHTKLEALYAYGLADDDPNDENSKYEQVLRLNSVNRYMDTETLLLIVGAVADYNDRTSGSLSSRTIYTEYRREKIKDGSWPYDVDPISGELLDHEGSWVTVGETDEEEEEDVRYAVTYPDVGYENNGNNINEESTGTWHPSIKDIEKSFSDSSGRGIDRGPDGRYQRMDYLEWQPVAALCCYYISMTKPQWGTYTEPDDTYYISKAKVEELMGLFSFDYDYVMEVVRNYDHSRYEFEDYMELRSVNVPFKTSVEDRDAFGLEVGLRGWERVRDTRRVPAWAPYRIANSYISYVYDYERVTEYETVGSFMRDYAYISGVHYYAQPSRLIEAMEEKIPHFSMDLYMYMLGMFPKAESSIQYFEDVILADDNAELKEWHITSDAMSPSIGVVVGHRQYSAKFGMDLNGDSSGMPIVGGAAQIPLYPARGVISSNAQQTVSIYIEPHPDIVPEGESYGLYQISNDAHLPLDASDGFTKDQLIAMINSQEFLSNYRYESSPLLCNERVRTELAKCLYNYQVETGSSVSAVLGLLTQEGGFTSNPAKEGYNFFHIKVGRNADYVNRTVGDGFRNYKLAYEEGVYDNILYSEPAVKAFSQQVRWVYDNYWSEGQNTYFKMVFNGYGDGATTGLGAYQQMHHSYCPPWDDPAMPYSNDSVKIVTKSDGTSYASYFWRTSSGTTHFGWVNKSATYRAKFYNMAQKFRDA